ncbi:MAG: AI-2E family transporter [Acidimicrobiia bacterium]|nr:AI-2E family transporter [Acidimicrobiia bacterium]
MADAESGSSGQGWVGETDMPRWIPRAIAILLFGFLGLLIAQALFFRVRGLLVLVVVSLFASFAIEPAVNYFEAKGVRRGIATGVVMVATFIFVAVFIFAMGAVVVGEVADFVDQAPEYVQSIEDWVNSTFDADYDADEVIEELSDADGPLRDAATNLGGQAVAISFTVLGLIFQVFTVALFTFYLVADGPRFRRTLCSFLRPDRQRKVLEGWEVAIEKTGGYLYSRVLLAILSAVATGIVLWILGIPYAVALALWVGLVSQFVPTVGTYIGGALPVLVALVEKPVAAIIVLAFIVVYQQIENYFFLPRITARTMHLHPAVAFGSVIAGAGLLGGVGAILALPAAAVIQAIGTTYLNRHEVIESEMTRCVGARRDAQLGGPGGAARTWRTRG